MFYSRLWKRSLFTSCGDQILPLKHSVRCQNYPRERMMVVTVFVDESLETVTLGMLWSTIDLILRQLMAVVPFELVVVNFALM